MKIQFKTLLGVILLSKAVIGQLNYQEIQNTGIVNVYFSTSHFSDFDGDGDMDLFLSGYDENDDAIARVYENDGNGNFTWLSNNNFEGFYYGASQIGDIDGDGDLDIVYSGELPSVAANPSKIYLNNGGNSFSESASSGSFQSIATGDLKLADMDNDNDLDIVVFNGTGLFLYENNGNGQFTQDINVVFELPDVSALGEQFRHSKFQVGDLDSDGFLDIAYATSITGIFPQGTPYEQINSGLLVYNQVNDTYEYYGLSNNLSGNVVCFDADGDNDLDLAFTGYGGIAHSLQSHLYFNDGFGAFGTPIYLPPGTSHGLLPSLKAVDIDNDNDRDLISCGYQNLDYFDPFGNNYVIDGTYPSTEILENDGNGNFTSVANTQLKDNASGSIAVADVNENGNKEVLLIGATGINSTDISTNLFELNSSGTSAVDELTQKEVIVYPNPTNGIVYLPPTNDETTVRVFSNGQLVKEVYGKVNYIDLSSLAQGIYFLEMAVESQTMQFKINKQ